MAESENLLQKAFYLGVGIAGFAAEKANETLQELKQQAEAITSYPDFPQKLQQMADEMVNKGKMNTEEARKFVEQMLSKQTSENISEESSAPRTIEIIVDDDDDDE
jgi:polyhydroxyalkanoate synthesis regulator phasin